MSRDVDTCDVMTNSKRRAVITNSIHPDTPEKGEHEENQTTKIIKKGK